MHILPVNTQCFIFIGFLVQLCLFYVFLIVYSYEYELKNNKYDHTICARWGAVYLADMKLRLNTAQGIMQSLLMEVL